MSGKQRDGWLWALWSQVRDKSQRRMRVAETLSLGGKRSLVLVECDGHGFLVGCGADQVSCVFPMPSGPAGLAVVHPWQAGEGAAE